ncbi:leucine-rich repeat transmembrane neuronal protein 4-like [Tribolium castaneum]|uniref:leucine-rich repeat transmembrane neuronal protein 4-like n=1 Tax=Tribolium castaneum TaxID=7070 RepID=UPI00077DA779|nr:PREDICTED: leucine-rich repeat transmembrane neuronal protein 4-like [Tribolium castaneum]|eukprot:XP_015833711.1 PREDICTED: leucine-rich repeat transmembrane neuronal protein 4-like [Tribolium castaneum]
MNFKLFTFLLYFQIFEGQTRDFCDQNCVEISGLRGPLYYETLTQLYGITDLKIFNNQITEIETGAICSLPTLQKLELNFAGNFQAPPLSKNTFRQCKHQLRHLFVKLDFEKPSKIDTDTFEDTHLRTLALESHKIGFLKRNFLKLRRESLTRLVLIRCHISGIGSNAFEGLAHLEELEISYNKNLTQIPEKVFRGLINLRRLFLDYNRIRDLSWSEFEGLSKLEFLNLSGNRILNFDPDKVSRVLPNLKYLEIKKNLWPCKLKENFASKLVEKMNDSVTVVYSDDNVCVQ